MAVSLGTPTPGLIPKAYAAMKDRKLPPLERAHAIEELRIHLYAFQSLLVEDARAGGATWQQVGELFRISRQAAEQRFGVYRRSPRGAITYPRLGEGVGRETAS